MVISRKHRISRLHDEKGNFINPSNLIDIIPALIEKIKASNQLNNNSFKPIIPYNAIRIFENYLEKDIQVVEWGSGRSTSWYAGKCQKIISAESNENWYKETLRILKKKSLKNFDLLLTKKSSEYVNKPIEKSDPKSRKVFIIDGSYRNSCALAVIDFCNKEDVIYLDDSDKVWALADAKEEPIDAPDSLKYAFTNLLNGLAPKGFACISVRGFSPTQLHVKEATFFFHKSNKKFIEAIKPFAAIL